ncbi:MAG: prepilin-type N-terminal cleavage/methylation domain-containing protein [Erysipelotrichaceae bacterium]|nr:prepilin-type N-terminal cleavage/methylation domain-containing protein [Erysipelotrichaceae bacterium]
MSSTEKGYTLLEMLLSLMIVTAMLLLSLNLKHGFSLDHYYYLNDYLLLQSEAMLEKQDRPYKNGIYINSMGHINLARTIDFGNHQVIVHLGNGYASIR